ncbi:Hcp family type VI secretion system effector [Pseudorhodoferax sp.]|uniref:Hcp family type VI secretion system effector n=1 Tax=Pseudorhodoferax sp. TaxID=1993553 RepID=UPI0039E51B87
MFPSPAAGDAASDLFLRVQTKRAGKVKGEATTEGHAEEIQLLRWNWGVSANTAIGSTERTARRVYRQLVVTKGIDSASTALLAALATNDEIKEAVLTMRKAGGEALDYFTMTLNGARVVAVDIDVGDDGRPLERVSIAFTKVGIAYQPQESAGLGSGTFSFDDEVLPS